MYRKCNQRGEFRTWHFTGELTPTPDITRIFSSYAHGSQHTDTATGPIVEVRKWLENLILNADKPDCISFISLRFSRTDVATWMSNARARPPSLDLHFEGYVQSISAIAQPRLNRWIPIAIWNSVGGKLSQSDEYNDFCRANEVYEYLNSGSLAANKGGRPSKGGQTTAKPSVRPDRCIQHLGFPISNRCTLSRRFPPVEP